MKKDAARTAEGLRPLQLPTCIRRLYGVIVVDLIGPPLEAAMSPHQAAVRDGTCGVNIRHAYQHLAGHREPHAPPPGLLWRAVLGDIAGACERVCQSAERGDISRTPATLLNDQSKAFERVSHSWMAKVMAGWGLPAWADNSLLALFQGRWVRSCVRG